jgi:peptidoglycan hydrolase CwlO-like protein
MDAETRVELDKIHERISSVKERVVNLEAQNPHINAALLRVEKGIDRLNGHIVKVVWAVLAIFITVVVKFTFAGGWDIPIPGI